MIYIFFVLISCYSDVIGVVKSVDDLRSITTKANKELKKRDVILVDESQEIGRAHV